MPKIFDEYPRSDAGKPGSPPGVWEFIAPCRNKGLKIAVAASVGMLKMKIKLELLGFADNTFVNETIS